MLDRNYRTREGEVDIVAVDGDDMVFVEVKTRRHSGLAFGGPEESLTRAKLRRVIAVSAAYLVERGYEGRHWRVDVVVVELERSGKPTRIELIKNAVEG